MLLKEAFCCQSAFVARLILVLELRSRNCYHFECMGWSFEMSLLSVSTSSIRVCCTILGAGLGMVEARTNSQEELFSSGQG